MTTLWVCCEVLYADAFRDTALIRELVQKGTAADLGETPSVIVVESLHEGITMWFVSPTVYEFNQARNWEDLMARILSDSCVLCDLPQCEPAVHLIDGWPTDKTFSLFAHGDAMME